MKTPIIASDEIIKIFSVIEEVLQVNCKLLQTFNVNLTSTKLSILLGEAFVAHASDFEIYAAYCNNYDTAIALLGSLKASNSQFAEFLEVCSRHPSCRLLDLGSFLIKPVQRVCKYVTIIL